MTYTTINVLRTIIIISSILLSFILVPIIGLYVNQTILTLAIISLIFGISTLGWNLLLGYGGMWFYGQIGVFGLSAYTYGLASRNIDPWLSFILSIIISIVSITIISLLSIRLKFAYFALATFAFNLLVSAIIIAIYPANVIFQIPQLYINIFGYRLRFDEYNSIPYYILLLLITITFLYIQKRMLNSSLGIRFIALKENENRALSLGMDPLKVRLPFVLVSVIFTSIAGSIYAQYLGSVSQSIFSLDIFITFLTILSLGGIGTFYGPLAASILWTIIDFWLSLYIAQYKLIILSIVTIVVLMYLRSGIGGLIDLISARLMRIETMRQQIKE